jgi:hypothetical protein
MKTWCYRWNRGEQVICNGSASRSYIPGCWVLVEQDIADNRQAGLFKAVNSIISTVISTAHSMDWNWNKFYG